MPSRSTVFTLLVWLITVTSAQAQSLECETARQQTTCAEWNGRGFHRMATVEKVKECLATGQVDVNQPVGGRTLLIRLAIAPSSSRAMRDGTDDTVCPETPAHLLALVDFLLNEKDRYGLDLDAKDRTGRTALHYALGHGASWPIAVRLIDAGADALAVSNERRAWAFRQDYWREFLGASEELIGSVGKTEDLKECRTVDCFVDGLLSK